MGTSITLPLTVLVDKLPNLRFLNSLNLLRAPGTYNPVFDVSSPHLIHDQKPALNQKILVPLSSPFLIHLITSEVSYIRKPPLAGVYPHYLRTAFFRE